MVYKRSLAHGVLVFGRGVTNVVTDLGTTESGGVIVDLVRLTPDKYSRIRSPQNTLTIPDG